MARLGKLPIATRLFGLEHGEAVAQQIDLTLRNLPGGVIALGALQFGLHIADGLVEAGDIRCSGQKKDGEQGNRQPVPSLAWQMHLQQTPDDPIWHALQSGKTVMETSCHMLRA